MVFVVLCQKALKGSTGSGSGFKASQKMGPRLEVSPDTAASQFVKMPKWMKQILNMPNAF